MAAASAEKHAGGLPGSTVKTLTGAWRLFLARPSPLGGRW
jgi:hypothetical protein